MRQVTEKGPRAEYFGTSEKPTMSSPRNNPCMKQRTAMMHGIQSHRAYRSATG